MTKPDLLTFRRRASLFGGHMEVGEPTFSNGKNEPWTLLAAAKLAIAHLTGEDLSMPTGVVVEKLRTAVETHGQ